MFKSRFALAMTLSWNYGMYSGFELLEHEPIPGREEYLNSEKYELKVRDWNRPGNIKDYITRLNRIRREQCGAAADRRSAICPGRRRRGDRLRQGIGRQHDNAVAGRDRAHRPRTADLLASFRRHRPSARRTTGTPVRTIVNLVTGERHALEWGGVRLTHRSRCGSGAAVPLRVLA